MIGYLIWWDLGNLQISRKYVRSLFRQEGLDVYYPKIKYKHILGMSINEVRKQSYASRTSLRPVKKIPKERYYYAIVDEVVDQTGIHVDCKQASTICFECATGRLSVDWPHPLFDKLKSIYDRNCESFSVRDMFLTLVNIIERSGGFKLKDSGGIYFVPYLSKERIKSLFSVFKYIEGNSFFYAIPVEATPAIREALLRPCLKFYMQHIADVKKRVCSPAILHERTIINEMRRVQLIRRQIAFYHRLIGIPKAELKKYLSKLNEALQRQLLAVQTKDKRELRKWKKRMRLRLGRSSA